MGVALRTPSLARTTSFALHPTICPTIRVAHTHNMRERLHKTEELLGIIRELFKAIVFQRCIYFGSTDRPFGV